MTRWQQFDKYCIRVTPILEAISRNGLGIDPLEQAAFFKRLEAERDGYLERIQRQVPLHLKPRKLWKRPPKNMEGVISLFPEETRKWDNGSERKQDGTKQITNLGTSEIGVTSGSKKTVPANIAALGSDLSCTTNTTRHPSQAEAQLEITSGVIAKKSEIKNSNTASPCATTVTGKKLRGKKGGVSQSMAPEQLMKSMAVAVPSADALSVISVGDIAALEKQGYKYMKLLPWNPRSWQQVAELAATIGVKLPRKHDAKDEADVSTESKHLRKAAKKHPIFADILAYRQRDKLVNSYQWKLDDNNRVHPNFGFWPSTWRKACRNPNIQTIPKRSDLAKQFRKMIVPKPGNVLIEGDSAAIEAVIVGHLAGSPRFIRLARAGVHGWLTSALHGKPISLDISDAALTAACQGAKKEWPDDYEKCKRVVHLSNYCGTPRRIAEEYPDEFPREADAAKLQGFYFETEAGRDIRAWQRQTVEVAHANKGLDNHFGLRHRFFSLYSYNARSKSYVLGDDAKRAVAFVPQSDASFVQSDILLRLVDRDSRFLEWIVAIIHDSIVLDIPECHADSAAAVLYEEMVRPLPQLDGLWIGAEVKRGYNLCDMEVCKL